MAYFNWSQMDRATLYSYFYSLNKSIVGKSLTPTQITKIISTTIKSVLPIKVVKHIGIDNKRGYVYMGGMYYSDYDSASRKAIELNLHFHEDDTRISITQYRFKRMAVRFADIMLHEMIHMRQFRARNFKSLPGYQSTVENSKIRQEQTYLGDRDEMGAFAFNIACEMIDKFGYDIIAIGNFLNTNSTKYKNSWWYSYVKAFHFDHRHPIIRRMKNLIMRQLDNAYLGKPFKTSNHLTY